MKYTVLGGGSWATAIVKILSENLPEITWYMRNDLAISHIKKYKHNPNYLSSVELHTNKIHLTSNINEAVAWADYLIFVIPSAFLVSELSKLTVPLKDKVIFSAIKGIVPESGLVVGEHLMEAYGINPMNIGVITGPCHAEEVALERLSYITVSCKHRARAKQICKLIGTDYIRTIESTDIYGTEYSAILKNIYAVAVGVANGLGYGDNFQAVLTCNAQAEIVRFLHSSYPDTRQTESSAYLGDLLVTCYSQFSRNRTFGTMIGKGYSVLSAQMEMKMVAEGYYATNGIYQIIKNNNIDAPIVQHIYRILYEEKNCEEEFTKLVQKLN